MKRAAVTAVVMLASTGASQSEPLLEESCSIVAETPNAMADVGHVEGLRVLDRDPTIPFRLTAPAGVSIKGVVCWRNEARLSKNDYLVASEYPLYIKAEKDDEEQNRTVSLERTKSGFRIRLISGPEWTDAEEREIRELVAFYNSAKSDQEPNKTMEPTR